MMRYRYVLTAARPMSAGLSGPRGNVRSANPVVPGATVRGALAALWWQRFGSRPSATDDFRSLFDSDLLIGQAVPDGWSLVSASTKVCKYRSQPACRGVQLDQGLPEVAWSWTTCWVCGGPLATKAGWANVGSATVMEARTRGQLTERETAEDGQLFTREALTGTGETYTLSGLMDAKGDLSWLDGERIRVGGARSVDWGSCAIALEQVKSPALPQADEHLVRLESPTIILDDFGGPDLSWRGLLSELKRVAQLPSLEASEQAVWLRSESVDGWHMRSRLPKAHDWALAPGSGIRVSGLTQAGWAKLQRGVGHRTLEGYGQLGVLTSVDAVRQPENEGQIKLKVLKAKVKPAQWPRVKRDLLSYLRRRQAASSDAALADLQQPNFDYLMGDARATANSVTRVPIGHLPGTIAQLEATK